MNNNKNSILNSINIESLLTSMAQVPIKNKKNSDKGYSK